MVSQGPCFAMVDLLSIQVIELRLKIIEIVINLFVGEERPKDLGRLYRLPLI